MINGTLIKLFFSEQLISLEVTIVWLLSFTKYKLVALFAIVLFFCPLLCIIRNNAFMSNWDVLIIWKKSISIEKKSPYKIVLWTRMYFTFSIGDMGSTHCGWCHPWKGDPEVYRKTKWLSVEKQTRKQRSSMSS